MKETYLISLMTWSFSRLRSFENCPYGFYKKYIEEIPEASHFYASYGKFIHEILERYFKKEISRDEAVDIYISRFFLEVTPDVRMSIIGNYYDQGKSYLQGIERFNERIVGVEHEVHFEIAGYPFVGYIDLILEDENKNLIIVDHKTRILRQKSLCKSHKKPAKYDIEFDEYAKQLYIYSAACEQNFGKLPSEIRFNCFRNRTVVGETFDNGKYEAAKQWAVNTIKNIEREEEWNQRADWFKCKNICGFSDTCEFASMV